jgi:nucleoside-diphosphate-sugar epimerase
MARKVLVTGGTGLLGQRLKSNSVIEFIKIGSELDLLLENGPESIVKLARQLGCEALLHLAWCANSVPKYEDSLDNLAWVSASLKIARRCVAEGIQFIGVGTGLEADLSSQNDYVKSKRELRTLLQGEILLGDVTWVRPHFVFDIHEKRPRIVAALFNQTNIELPTIEYGLSKHDYISSIDVAEGITAAIVSNLMGIIDIGSGQLTSNKAFVTAVCRQAGVELPKILDRSMGDSKAADTARLKSIGWAPLDTLRFLSE